MQQQIGRYRIESILGTGAMGVVYRAFDPHIQRPVALKTVRHELLSGDSGPDLIERFRAEARAAGRLQHPNVVSVYDFGEEDGDSYIAMEFVDGKPLNALVREGTPADPALILHWMTQLLHALDYAHANGVVHRDIKPGNLIITASQQLKVADFGVARLDAATLTHFGTVVGTPSYMSPEQFCGDPVDGRSDLFSAGVILFQLLTGRKPYTGSAATVMHQILHGTPPRPSEANASLPAPLDRLVGRAMARSPADRYPSARAFLQDMRTHFQFLGRTGQEGTDATQLAPRDATAARTIGARPVPQETVPGLARPPQGTDGTYTANGWRRDTLDQVEKILAAHIGPLARILVKKASLATTDLDALCARLSDQIPTVAGQQSFRQAMAGFRKQHGIEPATGTRDAATRPATGTLSTTSLQAITCGLSQQALDAIEKKLAAYVGPIAKVIVKRAARAARDDREFYRMVADQMTDEEQRRRFLKEIGLL